jgi:Recombination endonuclease VII
VTKRVCSIADCGKPHLARGYCHAHYMNDWYRRSPEGREKNRARMARVPKDVSRSRQLKHYYGVDGAWYAEQLLKQNGVCKICHKPENKTIKGKVLRLAVDHCHDTGKVRGLLCQACNRGIGCFSHDPTVLRGAIEYLDKS